MRFKSLLIGALLSSLLFSCEGSSNQEITSVAADSLAQIEVVSAEEDSVLAELLTPEVKPDCGYKDGTYPASVHFVDLGTGLSKTQTINVEVIDCQVISLLVKEAQGGKFMLRPAELDSAGQTPILEGPGGVLYDEVKVIKN